MASPKRNANRRKFNRQPLDIDDLTSASSFSGIRDVIESHFGKPENPDSTEGASSEAARNVETDPERPQYVWEPKGLPFSVRLGADVIARLEKESLDIFRAITNRGSEIGGILLGQLLPGWPTSVLVEDYEPVPCGYTLGPSYLLSEEEQERLGETLEKRKKETGLTVVGFFRSNTRPELVLQDDDQELFDEFFPEDHNIFVLAKPYSRKPCQGAIFVREGGKIRTESSPQEFAFSRAELEKLGALQPGLRVSSQPERVGPASTSERAAPISITSVQGEAKRPAPAPVETKPEPEPVHPPIRVERPPVTESGLKAPVAPQPEPEPVHPPIRVERPPLAASSVQAPVAPKPEPEPVRPPIRVERPPVAESSVKTPVAPKPEPEPVRPPIRVERPPVAASSVQAPVAPKPEPEPVRPPIRVERPPVAASNVQAPVAPPRVEARTDPKAETRVQAPVEPKVEARTEPKIEPKVAPRVEPKIDPSRRWLKPSAPLSSNRPAGTPAGPTRPLFTPTPRVGTPSTPPAGPVPRPVAPPAEPASTSAPPSQARTPFTPAPTVRPAAPPPTEEASTSTPPSPARPVFTPAPPAETRATPPSGPPAPSRFTTRIQSRIPPSVQPRIENLSSKPTPGVEPPSAPRFIARVEPRVGAPQQPKAEPKTETKVEAPVTPKVETTVAPKVETTVAPKVEPPAPPRVEVKIEPVAEPKAEPPRFTKIQPRVQAKPEPEPEPEPAAPPVDDLQDAFRRMPAVKAAPSFGYAEDQDAASPRKSRWILWGLPVAIAIVVAAIGVYFFVIRPNPPVAEETRAAAEQAPARHPAILLSLRVEGSDAGLTVFWDGLAAPVSTAPRGVLSIRDGAGTKNIDLSADDLQKGLYQYYKPRTDDVVVKLDIKGLPGNQSASGTTHIFGARRLGKTAK